MDLAKADSEDATALRLAAYNGYIGIVELLLAEGVAVEAKGNDGSTPLKVAADQGHADVVKLLLENRASVDEASKDGWIALTVAADNGHAEEVRLLLEKDAFFKNKNLENATALTLATENGHADVVTLLLDKIASGKETSKYVGHALSGAAYYGHANVVELILAKQDAASEKNKNKQDASKLSDWENLKVMAMLSTAERGHHATVSSFIKGGAEQYPVMEKVFNKHHLNVTNVIVGAWFKSTKNKFDGAAAISYLFKNGSKLNRGSKIDKPKVLHALASGGLTLTEEDFARLLLSVKLTRTARSYVHKLFVGSDIPQQYRIDNALWAGDHVLADELINGPAISSHNPLGLNSSASEQLSNLSHITVNKGDYRHALGELRDRSWKAHLTWERNAMLAAGWRSKITALAEEASKEATEASKQISKLLANTRKGLGLIDEVGSPVPADNMRLKDTLLAFELERNEPLNQIAEPPDSLPAGESIMPAQTTHQLAGKAQAQAILASNKTYKSLILNMPALAEAKKIEKAVRSGSLTRSTAVIKLNKLLSETEQLFLMR